MSRWVEGKRKEKMKGNIRILLICSIVSIYDDSSHWICIINESFTIVVAVIVVK